MRAWDNWNSYLDNDRNLLHGKIRFCQKGTTDDVAIFDRDASPVRNPAFTDMLGRTEGQVFVEGNVTAYFYKYIGTGDMTTLPGEDYDPSRWAYQYSSDDVVPVTSIDISSDTAMGVPNMTGLRALDPSTVPSVGGAKLAWLYGYYAAGDTSPVLYVWEEGSQEPDDGGSVVRANAVPGKGRWHLATRELHFDVRHFGIFPLSDMYSTDYSFTSQLANCALYLDKEGLDAWFPAINDEMSYYLFDGTNTFAIKGDIYVSDAVRFQCKSGTVGTAIMCHELHKSTPFLFKSDIQDGSSTLTADHIRMSWVGYDCTGVARVGWIIDDDTFSRTITGKEVHFETNGSAGLVIDNCAVESDHKISGEITINNCEIRTSWFASGYDWSKLTMSGNRIRMVNCSDADTYVTLKNKQNEPDYGDIGEQTVTGKTLLAGAVVENGMFSSVTLQGSTELHNISGSVYASGTSLALNAIDCWLGFSAPCTVESISFRRGSLSGAAVTVSTSLSMDNVNLTAQLNTVGASASIIRSRIDADISASNISLEEDEITATVTQTDVLAKVNVDIVRCRFKGTGKHYVAPERPMSEVYGRWVGNYASGSVTPVQFDYTNIKPLDFNHPYTYEDNTGKFLPRFPSKTVVTDNFDWKFPQGRNDISPASLVLASGDPPFGAIGDTVGVWINDLSTPMPFFAVGAATAVFKIEVGFNYPDAAYGHMDAGTQYFMESGMAQAYVADPSSYTCGTFNGKMVGEPIPFIASANSHPDPEAMIRISRVR